MRQKPIYMGLSLFILCTGIFLTAHYHLWDVIMRNKQPNILLISVDALRADHLGMYGYQRQTSPRLDAFFKNKFIYYNASSTAPCTMPSVRQIITGNLEQKGPTLAQILKKQGYATAAVVSQHMFHRKKRKSWFKAGFQHWDIQSIQEQDHHNMTTRTADQVTNKALQWLNAFKYQRPFFMWLHYFDPHDPYQPPIQHALWHTDGSSFTHGDRRTILERAERFKNLPRDERGMIFGKAEQQHLIDLYDGEIHFTDEQIGFILDFLANKKLLKSTIIIFTSDHGENLGEHYRWDHCQTMLQTELQVPLAIHIPDRKPQKSILKTIAASTVDIVPTLCSLLDIPYPTQSKSGSSLFFNTVQHTSIAHYAGQAVLRKHHWKLLAYSDKKFKSLHNNHKKEKSYQKRFYHMQALYNLHHDPHEQRNLIHKQPDMMQILTPLFQDKFRVTTTLEQIDTETINHLKSIGYIQ